MAITNRRSTNQPSMRHRRSRRGLWSLLALGTLTATALSTAAAQGAYAASTSSISSPSSVSSTSSSGQVPVKRSCGAPAQSRHAACFALVRTDVKAVRADALGPDVTPSGFGPSDLRSAYNLTGSGSATETVAIVDAFDDPNAESDLAVYRSQYGLSACTTANGCFRKVNQTGGTSYPSGDTGWGDEISLDLDMVSAIAPGAHILLVEATSNSFTDLGTAENEAVALGAKFVSNSYGGSESSSDTGYDSSYFNHPGVAITASSGDGAYSAGTEYPAASQYVTSVGGTSLTTASNARGWSENVWETSTTEGAGSGCSAFDAKPIWQSDPGCAGRMVADVSADADPATGVAVYDTYGEGGWLVFGGTSVASPIIASVYALAGVPGGADRPAQDLYSRTADLFDVTSGANGTCSPAYFCNAQVGYDGPTGLGTPNGTSAFSSTTPVTGLPGTWKQCAAEGGICAVSSNSTIAFGAGGKFFYGTAGAGTSCNDATFGDPNVGVLKACYVQSVPSAPNVWTNCAAENGTCTLSGTMIVGYGAPSRYAYGTFSTSVGCNNTVFGDPFVGTVKGCAVTGPPPSVTTWSKCADESGTCSFSGTHEVAYGANGLYFYANLTGGVGCNNTVFGDPNVGTVKACYIQ